jgi:hypothetical protein
MAKGIKFGIVPILACRVFEIVRNLPYPTPPPLSIIVKPFNCMLDTLSINLTVRDHEQTQQARKDFA